MGAALKMDRSLEDVRYYLWAWRRWISGWRAPLGFPGAIPTARLMVPTVAWDSTDNAGAEADEIADEIGGHILRAVDAEVESLPANKRAAVRLTYLNEALPAVFRSCRMERDEVRRLCAEAEVEMVPKLRIRGVVLGGH